LLGARFALWHRHQGHKRGTRRNTRRAEKLTLLIHQHEMEGRALREDVRMRSNVTSA
jgi:hypothetical protein